MLPTGKYWSPERPENVPLQRPLKILFEHPRNIPNWRPGNVPIWRPTDVSKWRPGDVLIRRPRDVSWRLIRDVSSAFLGRPLDELENTFLGQCGFICWMSLNFILLFFGNLLDWPNQSKSNSILTVYLEPTRTSKMKLFLLNQLMAFSR